ncbi:MAG: UDP-N-acetylmuramoyl-L-alanyl-D-glutamate--2,6-diaminopimelate ligase [Actinomycetota bacterium]
MTAASSERVLAVAISSGPLDPHGPRSLSELAAASREHEIRGDASVRVSDVVVRSSDARPGALFACIPGANTDGHAFAGDAAERGAAALLVERWVDAPVPQLRVPSVRVAIGPVAAEVFGRPADRMTVVGVTGTNGKTTTTYLLESVFRAAGRRPGVIGTTGVHIDGEVTPFPRTTPEAPDLHRLFARMEDAGVDAVAMEVSSHGLDQHRVDGVRYACAVFTNLSQDHLDYHPTMQAYLAAKARLFTREMSAAGVVNADSPEGRSIAAPGLPTVTYAVDAEADVRARDVVTTAEGIRFTVDGTLVGSRLRGRFNVENCLAAFAAARVVGIDDDVVARGIAALRGVPGRLETVEEGQDFLVIVDYAHTPDGIRNVLRAARPLARGRVIIVFGCGGDRDRAKRPLMGEAATSMADLSIVTSDNPRSEDPLAIIAAIEPGARAGGNPYEVESDRRAAIARAVELAEPGDVVVIAGKGHETGQEFADRTIPFDDRLVAADALRAVGRRA